MVRAVWRYRAPGPDRPGGMARVVQRGQVPSAGGLDESLPATGAAPLLREAPEPSLEKEDVNYRYAADSARSCGRCRHFRSDVGACDLVAGLIRRVDTCDRWAAAVGPAGATGGERRPVRAILAEEAEPPITDACPADERDGLGHCPGDPGYVDPDPGDWAETDEVAPPGWSGTVKAMKRQGDIDNPFALAWALHNRGATPHKPEEPEEPKEARRAALVHA